MASSPTQTRSERFSSLNPDDYPALSNRDSVWRYAPIPLVEKFISNNFDSSEYPLDFTGGLEPDPGKVKWVSKDAATLGFAGLPEDRVSALAWQRTDRVLLINLEDKDSVMLGRNFKSFAVAHTVVRVTTGAAASLFINNTGEFGVMENFEIILEDNADLQFITCQNWGELGIHLSYHFVHFGKNSRAKHTVATAGGRFVRLNPVFRLLHPGAEVESLGVYFAQDEQHFEHQVYVHHAAEATKSEINYRGVLSGQGARTAWIGDVLIDSEAKNSDSYEQNRNLMIGSGTRADSVPNLEIKNGNILGAGHASATMRFDDEHLFYLQSRGIDKSQALRMVVAGFVDGMLQKADVGCGQEMLFRLFSDKLDAISSRPDSSCIEA